MIPPKSPDPVTCPTSTDVALEIAEPLVRGFEGLRLTPYPDSGGVWTIGYGTTRIDGARVTRDTPPITAERADALLLAELRPVAEAIDGMIHVAVSVQQRAALYSLAYNVGWPALQYSALLRALNRGDVDAAADHFLEWIYAGGRKIEGLRNRRKRERALFLSTGGV